jgi:hypothetical protein
MSVPTHRQRIRSAIRGYARANDPASAAKVTLEEAAAELGTPVLASAVAWSAFGPPSASNLCDAGERRDAEEFLMGVLREMEEAGAAPEYRARMESAIDTLAHTLPPIMGAKDAAERLGMLVTNLGKLSPPLVPETVISGRVPVYLAVTVEQAAQRREGRTVGEREGRIAA